MKYTHVFFDLDRTLWDFDTNTRDTIFEIYNSYNFSEIIGDFDEWYKVYKAHNIRLWENYAIGKVTKATLRDTRFYLALKDFGIDDEKLGLEFGQKFVEQAPDKTTLYANAHEVLQYLSEKYQLHIATNGFNEIQFKKLENTDIKKYFTKIFTCEDIGYNKPHQKFFQHAITTVHAKKEECVMIGDDFNSDILGAKNFGIDQIYFEPKGALQFDYVPTHTIHSLIELKEIL